MTLAQAYALSGKARYSGVLGRNSAGEGVRGDGATGVHGTSAAATGNGVYGEATGYMANGVYYMPQFYNGQVVYIAVPPPG